ncbi:radical SAM protein, partial [Enterococcus faecalis]|nr:radical SAM protein [Enterococcus faecalis]
IIDENLLDSNVIDSFIISVDGPSAIHDILRKRRGSYKSTIQNINKIIKKNIPLTLATTVSSQNFETLDELSVLIKKIKPNFWRINSCLPIGKALNNILFANANNIYKKIVTYSLDKDLPLIITDLHSVKSLKIDYQKQIDNFFSSIWISPDTSISLYPRSLGAKTICLTLENLTLLDYLYKEISQDFDS